MHLLCAQYKPEGGESPGPGDCRIAMSIEGVRSAPHHRLPVAGTKHRKGRIHEIQACSLSKTSRIVSNARLSAVVTSSLSHTC